jgi:sulfonate transport system ATP-binding protein
MNQHTNIAAPALDVPLAVRTTGLLKGFGGHSVLERLDLDIRAGEFVALLGRSGSGKSTLLRILSGFDEDFAGDVEVAETRSIVFQEPRLLPWSRVLANVTLGLPRHSAERLGLSALAEVGLDDKADVWPITLSGGEAQRVSLARALVREPDLLMLDEPFGALDALTRLKMHDLVQKLCAKHHPAVLLVTHDVDEAITLADRIIVLRDGRLAYDEPVGLAWPRNPGEPGFAALRRSLLTELGVAMPIDAEPPARRYSAAD